MYDPQSEIWRDDTTRHVLDLGLAFASLAGGAHPSIDWE
jgi:hypothetical protein